MFTGLVEEGGVVAAVAPAAEGARLWIAASAVLDGLEIGDSVAVNGACLTAVEIAADGFAVDAVAETLRRTNLGALAAGDRVNLERPMRLGDRLDGHLVQGHVDGVGEVEQVQRASDALLVDIRLPADLEPLMVLHGSVAVDGVSLTVNALPSPGILQVSLIDHTARQTTLGALRAGDAVHVEADMVGKYVRQLVAPYAVAR